MGRALIPAGVALALTLAVAPAVEASRQADRWTVTEAGAPALNHVYVVLDAETYAAVRDSDELARLLGRTDGGLPDYAPPGPDADRVFFRGRETYLEFFAPDNRFGEPVGKVGLALGHDAPAAFDALEQAWRATCGDRARRTPVEWRRSQPSVPWYDAVQCDDTAAGAELAVWAMVYRPEFQRWQSGANAGAPPRTARADVLASRRAAGQGRFDVTAVAIDVDAGLKIKLVSQFEQAGLKRTDTPEGIRMSGQGWTILLRESDGSPRALSLELDAETPSPASLPLGRAHLRPSTEGTVAQFDLQLGEGTETIPQRPQ